MLRKPSSSTAQQPAVSQPPTWLRTLELAVEVVKVLAWPSLVLVVAIVFFGPLNDIAHSAASKLRDASKVSIGSLSVEVAEKARESGNPELAAQVGALSPAAIEQLLRTDRTDSMILLSRLQREGRTLLGMPASAQVAALRELESKGFIEFKQSLVGFLERMQALPKTDELPDSETIWYVVPFAPESPQFKELREQGHELTDKGRLANEAIVKAVAAQLTRGAT